MPSLSSCGEVEQFMLIIQSTLIHIYEVLLWRSDSAICVAGSFVKPDNAECSKHLCDLHYALRNKDPIKTNKT